MQIKKFEAPTIQEALDTIKRELGPDAIILQTRKNKQGFGLMSRGSVEVTAAISEKSLEKKKVAEKSVAPKDRDAYQHMTAERQSKFIDKVDRARQTPAKPAPRGPSPWGNTYGRDAKPQTAEAEELLPVPATPAIPEYAVDARVPLAAYVNASADMEAEIKQLKGLVEEMRKEQAELRAALAHRRQAETSFVTKEAESVYEQLVLAGVDRRLSQHLVRTASNGAPMASAEDLLDRIAGEMLREVSVQGPSLEGGLSKEIAFVGTHGSGKSTCVLKLAHKLHGSGKKVALLECAPDFSTLSPLLSTAAKLLGVPHRSVANAAELEAARGDFSHYDLILIDTQGYGAKDAKAWLELKELLKGVPQVLWVVSALTRDMELMDFSKVALGFRPNGLAVTHLDEAMSFGNLFNLNQRVKLPLSYFSTGTRVPEDLEAATAERVVSLILDI